jgi:hypothetical protein
MKIRNSFVSNSSTSSFIIIGSRISEAELKELKWWWDRDGNPGENLPKDIDVFHSPSSLQKNKNEEYVVGKVISDSEDWGLKYKEIEIEKLNNIFKDVENVIKRPIKMILGTRQS